MGSPSAPQAPDPIQTANAQTASNRETAQTQFGLNAVNQADAQGNTQTWNQIGTWADGTPRYSSTQAYSPANQQLYQTGQQTQQNLANVARDQSARLGGLLAQPLDWSQQQSYLNNFTDQSLNRSWDRQQQQFDTDLVNRGIRPGSTQYTQLMGDFRGDRSNAYNAANVANYNTALQSQVALQDRPLNQLLALAGQGQIQSPNFVATPAVGVAGTDIAGLTQQNYANQYQNYANQQNQSNQMLGGLFSAGASLLPLLSDRRAKKDIVHIGATNSGVPIYRFSYKHGGPVQIGYMAQDLLETHPEAVTMGPDNLYRVDYSKVS